MTSEVVLQTIVEKLEAFEISLLKDNNSVKEETIQSLLKEIKSVKSEMANLPLEFEKSTEKTSKLLQSITALNYKLNNPLTNEINLNHHFHKGIWIAMLPFIFCCLLPYGWIHCHDEKWALEVNDIKYRYLKVNGNNSLLKATYSTASLYNLNKAAFVQLVVSKEQILDEQVKQFRLAAEKKKDSVRPGKRVLKKK